MPLPFSIMRCVLDALSSVTRGNMYSQRHNTLSNSSTAFWDFCIDDFASSDIPSFVSYILDHTRQQKLSYIGFSQGSAQCFAALSTNKELNKQLEVFIALAPIMRPREYASAIIDQCLKWRSVHYPQSFCGDVLTKLSAGQPFFIPSSGQKASSLSLALSSAYYRLLFSTFALTWRSSVSSGITIAAYPRSRNLPRTLTSSVLHLSSLSCIGPK